MSFIVPTVDLIGDEELTNGIIDRGLTELHDNMVTVIREHAFRNCKSLLKVVFGSVGTINAHAFYGCSSLKTADFHSRISSYIMTSAFDGCSALEALIFRSDQMVGLWNADVLNNSGVSKGKGYVYVPKSLVDTYKADADWSTFANQIRAIEDYPDVCEMSGKVWAQSNITSQFKGVIRRNGLWVAYSTAGGTGAYYSEDGKTWTQSNLTIAVQKVAYARGMWVAATGSGLYYSTNGKSWTVSNKGSSSYTWMDVFFADGLWIAGGQNKQGFVYSEDGKTWTQSNITNISISYEDTIKYGGGLFVAGSQGGLYYSTDGKTWTQSDKTDSTVRGVTYANGIWVASFSSRIGLWYSTDGKAWTQSNVTGTMGTFVPCYAGGVWVANGGSTVYYSEDGKNWTASSLTGTVRTVIAADGGFVAGGQNIGIYYSEDGITWTQSNKTTSIVWGVAYGDCMWVAAATDGLWYSE